MLDESREEELWRLRSAEYDLDIAKEEIARLQAELEVQAKHLLQHDALQQRLVEETVRVSKLLDKVKELEGEAAITAEKIKQFQLQVGRMKQGDRMAVYGMKITNKMPQEQKREIRSRRQNRLSR